MSLVKCSKCGKIISDKTKKCIHCGYPLKKCNCQYCLLLIPVLLIGLIFFIIFNNKNVIYNRIVNNAYRQDRENNGVYQAYGKLTFYEDYTGIFSYNFDINLNKIKDIDGNTKFKYSIDEDTKTITIEYLDDNMKLSSGDSSILKYDLDTDCMYLLSDEEYQICKES